MWLKSRTKSKIISKTNGNNKGKYIGITMTTIYEHIQFLSILKMGFIKLTMHWLPAFNFGLIGFVLFCLLMFFLLLAEQWVCLIKINDTHIHMCVY